MSGPKVGVHFRVSQWCQSNLFLPNPPLPFLPNLPLPFLPNPPPPSGRGRTKVGEGKNPPPPFGSGRIKVGEGTLSESSPSSRGRIKKAPSLQREEGYREHPPSRRRYLQIFSLKFSPLFFSLLYMYNIFLSIDKNMLQSNKGKDILLKSSPSLWEGEDLR